MPGVYTHRQWLHVWRLIRRWTRQRQIVGETATLLPEENGSQVGTVGRRKGALPN